MENPPETTRSRTVYRCAYASRKHRRDLRASRLFRTEAEARAHCEEIRARRGVGFCAVWRVREVKKGRRWEADLDHEETGPLDR